MKAIMKFEDLTTIGQLKDFLSGTQAVVISVTSDKGICFRRRCRVSWPGSIDYPVLTSIGAW
ncbi:MAG: hypothetical protein M0Q95_03840 [Porticoccaceae bacterium]|nr:hypothetical protein [Porticoccaceae bacterium]